MIQETYKGFRDIIELLKQNNLYPQPENTPLEEQTNLVYRWYWEPRGGGGLHLKGTHIFEFAIISWADNREQEIRELYERMVAVFKNNIGHRTKIEIMGLEGSEKALILRVRVEVVSLEQGGVL